MAKGKFSTPRKPAHEEQAPDQTFPELTTTAPEAAVPADISVGSLTAEDFSADDFSVDGFIPPEPDLTAPGDNLPHEYVPEEYAPEEELPEAAEPEAESPSIAKNKKIVLISLCCVALVLLIGIVATVGFFLNQPGDDGLILNNVTVAGVNLGGMTLEQAEQVLRTATEDTYTKQDMVITLPGATITLSPADTGAKLDVEAAAKAAYHYGRTGSRAEREAAKAQSLTGPYHIALLSYMELDTAYILQTLERYCAGFNSDFAESSYEFEGEMPALSGDAFDPDAACQTLLLNPGTPGQHLDVNALYNQVLDAYSFNTFLVEVDESALGDVPAELDLDAIYAQFCSEAVSASVDPETYEIIPEVYGYTFNLKKAKELLAAAEPGVTIGIPMEYVEPEILASDFFADVLGSYETKHTNSENRNTNLRLACEAINGYILMPGETFDYNQALGERTAEAGYKAAAAYSSGQTVYELGGGICQVSSTLYYCALIADLEIVTRDAHSYLSSYMPYGMDATVSWGGPDFRFKNNTTYPIRIEAEVADGYVKIRLLGTDLKFYYVEMEYEIISWETYETVYEEYAPDNAEGYTDGQEIQSPYTGCTVKTYRCRYDKETGELISRDFEARSQYKARDQIIVKIVTPTEATEPPPESTEAPTDATEPPTEETTEPPTEETTEPPADSGADAA